MSFKFEPFDGSVTFFMHFIIKTLLNNNL